MLNLHNSIFKIHPVQSGTVTPSTAIFAFSFKSLSNSETPRILFSNERGTRAASQYNRKIGKRLGSALKIINGKSSKEIFIEVGGWTVVLIQYMTINDKSYCHYFLNYESGTFYGTGKR